MLDLLFIQPKSHLAILLHYLECRTRSLPVHLLLVLILLLLKPVNKSFLADLSYLKQTFVVEVISMLGSNAFLVEVRVL